MRKSLACMVLVSAVALAGCASKDASAPDPTPVTASGGIPAPEWAVGDYWTFSNMDAMGNQSTMSIIVTGDAGGDWTVDTNDPTVALYDAREDISYLGSVRKSDLAGSQGSDRVQYFDFPLTENKTWRTTWDGLAVEIRVVKVFDDGAVLRATTDGRVHAEYEYSSQRRYFEYLDFYGEDGSVAYEMTTSDAGRDFSGTIYRYTLGDPQEFSASEADVQEVVLDIPGATELGIVGRIDCGGAPAGQIGAVLSTAQEGEPHPTQLVATTDDPEWSIATPCPAQTMEDEATVEVQEGLDYYLEFGALAQGGGIDITLEPRTRETIQVG